MLHPFPRLQPPPAHGKNIIKGKQQQHRNIQGVAQDWALQQQGQQPEQFIHHSLSGVVLKGSKTLNPLSLQCTTYTIAPKTT